MLGRVVVVVVAPALPPRARASSGRRECGIVRALRCPLRLGDSHTAAPSRILQVDSVSCALSD
jgi:hypothetical protein